MKNGISHRAIITIVVIVLLFLGIGFFLFKVSPQSVPSASSYNASLDTSGAKQISAPPAFDPKTDHYLGNPQAKNSFIEYGDMECPACAAFNDTSKQIATQFPDTVYVFRYFPLVQIHPNSVEAALASEAAGAQGKYWEMHDLLFQKQADWESLDDPLSTFATYAQQAGVPDTNTFQQDITSKKYLSAIEQDNDQALGLNLSGTPSLFFNGHELQVSDIAGLLSQAQPFLNK